MHFSGHGKPSGEILFVAEELVDGQRVEHPVSRDAIRETLESCPGNIRLVLLNACYTQIHAEAIRDTFDCVRRWRTCWRPGCATAARTGSSW